MPLEDVEGDYIVSPARVDIYQLLGVVWIRQPGFFLLPHRVDRQQIQKISGQVAMWVDDPTTLILLDKLPQHPLHQLAFATARRAHKMVMGVEVGEGQAGSEDIKRAIAADRDARVATKK